MEQRVSPRLAIGEWLRAASNLKEHRSSDANSKQTSTDSNGVGNGDTWLTGKQDFHTRSQRLESENRKDTRRNSYNVAIKRRRSDSRSPFMDNTTLLRPVKMSRREYGQKSNKICNCHTPRLSSVPSDSEPGNSESRATSSIDKSQSLYEYARRPRRKTRHDKYELKQPNLKSRIKIKHKKASRVKAERRRKRSEKTGATLLHNFSANNVTTERLTLKHDNLGLFKRGRASTPQIREGLPDLAFSEIKFLGPKHNRDSSGREAGSKNGTNPTKKQVVDKEEEISRFFEGDRGTRSSRSPDRKGRDHDTKTSITPQKSAKECLHDILDSLSSVVANEVPGRPFLGFGDRGPQHKTGPGAKGAIREQSSRSASRSRKSRKSGAREPKGKTPLSSMQHSQEHIPRKESVAAIDKALQEVAELPTKDSNADLLLEGHEIQHDKSNDIKQIEHEEEPTSTNSTIEDQKKAPEDDQARLSINPFMRTLEKIPDSAVDHEVLENVLKNKQNDSNSHEFFHLAESLQKLPIEERVRMQADVLSLLAKWDIQGSPGQWHPLATNHSPSILRGSKEAQEQNHGANVYKHDNEHPAEQVYLCCDKDSPPASMHTPAPQEQIKKFVVDYDKVRVSSNFADHGESNLNHRGTHFSGENSFKNQHKTDHLVTRRESNRLSIRASVWDSSVGLYEQQAASVSTPSTMRQRSKSRGTTATTRKSSANLPTHVYGVSLVDAHKNLASCGKDAFNSLVSSTCIRTQPNFETQGYYALEADQSYKEYSPAVVFSQSASGSEINYKSKLQSPTGQADSQELEDTLEEYPPEPRPHLSHENSEWRSDTSPAAPSCPTDEDLMINLEMGGFWKPHFRY